MRFDVHKVRTYLVNALNEAADTVAEVRHDGTDLILVDLTTGESVIIYLIDRLMPVQEIKTTLTENTAKNLHTLFVLWSDMLLPQENRLHLPEDWMDALLTLYNGKIYGYDSYGPYASVFPVHFTRQSAGLEYFITYGDAVNAAHLHCDYVHVEARDLKGFWRVADFAERVQSNGNGRQRRSDSQQNTQEPPRTNLHGRRTTLAAYFEVLELSADADRGAVRQAYYQLARRYHPDVSGSPDSTARMQQINEAYQRIMAHFEKEV
ncbi:MAG: J domain-containing protein [Anaerolineae bacterium]|nr:J domain-containing protein [Anaerolineae bacterium]